MVATPEPEGPPSRKEESTTVRPALVAFTSKRGASETLGLPTGKLPYGPQLLPLEGTEVWVMPSTSPLGHTHFRLEPWQALAARVRELRGVAAESTDREPGGNLDPGGRVP